MLNSIQEQHRMYSTLLKNKRCKLPLIRTVELLSNQKSLRVGMDTSLSNLWILFHFKELKIESKKLNSIKKAPFLDL
jgi:hypothetical protein